MKYVFFLIGMATLFSCTMPGTDKLPVPVLSPEAAIRDFQVETGFEVQVVASEPLVEDPVAMVFDADANMWVVEMRGYMNDQEGSSETVPSGRIKILRDRNKDGTYDTASVFLDNLVLPRAIALAYNGLLVIEPPCLYFVENNNGRPGKKTMIDSTFADAGNVEHQPNGLVRNMDNWYYCAKSDKRVRYYNHRWEVETTQFRGQWGISPDDTGRLFYNDNSNLLYADNLLPNSLGNNPLQTRLTRQLYGSSITSNRVFPRRATRGINRGYEEGMLDPDGKLVNVTSACGPVIYRGDNFPVSFYGNAFVMEPVVYLIKRLVLKYNALGVNEGAFAYEEKEFLTATDERFRPVNAFNAPDGSLYVIDMHRGLIQHTTYLTQYLRDHVDSMALDKPVHLGRIYRIKWKANDLRQLTPLSDLSSKVLVNLYEHKNAWHRETAQRLLVERQDTTVAVELRNICLNNKDLNSRLLALWTLEAWDKLSIAFLRQVATVTKEPVLTMHCMFLISQQANETSVDALQAIRIPGNFITELQLAASLATLAAKHTISWESVLLTLKNQLRDSLYVDIVVSHASNQEKAVLKLAKQLLLDDLFLRSLQSCLDKANQQSVVQLNHLSRAEKERFHDGRGNYIKYCSSCHAENGEGMPNLGPPLANSEWVTTADITIPLRILLDGLQGSLVVNGTNYHPAAGMPGLRTNRELNNGTIAAILTFIRNSWGNKASATDALEVGKVRSATATQKIPYKPEELLKVNQPKHFGMASPLQENDFQATWVSQPGKWKKLFNGKNLEGWHQVGGKAEYIVQNNTIVGISVENTPNSFLVTDEVFHDFILELEFRIDSNLNSGIQIRSNSLPEYNNGQFHGYQVEIDPSPRAWSGGIYDEGRRGWLYDLKNDPKAQQAFHQHGWNHYRIEAIGPVIKTWVNGVPVANLRDDMTQSGHIGLQVHSIGNDAGKKGKTIVWRKIKIYSF